MLPASFARDRLGQTSLIDGNLMRHAGRRTEIATICKPLASPLFHPSTTLFPSPTLLHLASLQTARVFRTFPPYLDIKAVAATGGDPTLWHHTLIPLNVTLLTNRIVFQNIVLTPLLLDGNPIVPKTNPKETI